ncbi:MAG TPA: hypothetical protein VII56_15985 [Rhizomicrobium sp.]
MAIGISGRRIALVSACSALALASAALTMSALTVSALAAPKHAAVGSAVTKPGTAQGDCDTPTTPFCNALMKPTVGWKGHVFHLAQDYPATAAPDQMPWLKFDPKTQGNDYLKSVLDYFYEGNIKPTVEESFDPAQNSVRKWYNAPWQDFGKGGREFIHGLTRERVTAIGELYTPPAACKKKPLPKTCNWNNYAVGFYNMPGGTIIGRVWSDHGKPDPALASFPEGTVAAKLLFTTAPVAQVPYLAGAPQWQAYVYADPHIQTSDIPNDPAKRVRAVLTVRLLQIDIAVKDSRVASTTGWIMGTFVYGGGPGGPKGAGWTNVAPVGIMWGNDPQGAPLKETVLNAAVHMPHVGYQGRLNGPVDNPISSCLSCHATGESPVGAGMIPSPAGNSRWFQNTPSGTPFDAGSHSTDYSLQLSVGIANFLEQMKIMHAPTPTAKAQEIARKNQLENRSPREGSPID